MTASTDEETPLDALHSVLLESIRVGSGNWRLYFSGVEVTVWGNISLTSDNITVRRDAPDFFNELISYLGYELMSTELIPSGIVFHFGIHRLTFMTEDDGELVSILCDDWAEASIWTLTDGVSTHSLGPRESFWGIIA
jgi:hypothetical protein